MRRYNSWPQELCPMEYYPQTKTRFPRRLVLLTRPASEKPLVNNSCKASSFCSVAPSPANSHPLSVAFISVSPAVSVFLLCMGDDLELIKSKKDFEVGYLALRPFHFLLWCRIIFFPFLLLRNNSDVQPLDNTVLLRSGFEPRLSLVHISPLLPNKYYGNRPVT